MNATAVKISAEQTAKKVGRCICVKLYLYFLLARDPASPSQITRIQLKLKKDFLFDSWS